MLAYKTRSNKKNRGNSFAGTLTMKCNVANEKIVKPALPSLLWSHCIAVFKAKKEKNYYLFFLKAETFMHGELLGMGATMYC